MVFIKYDELRKEFSFLVISGLNHQNLPNLPSSIDVGCHNAEDNVTLSGPAEDMEIYLETLKKQNIFVRIVNSNGIAYHSRMVMRQADFVKKFIDKVNYFINITIRYIYINIVFM